LCQRRRWRNKRSSNWTMGWSRNRFVCCILETFLWATDYDLPGFFHGLWDTVMQWFSYVFCMRRLSYRQNQTLFDIYSFTLWTYTCSCLCNHTAGALLEVFYIAQIMNWRHSTVGKIYLRIYIYIYE
jgi:hypothetical protein